LKDEEEEEEEEEKEWSHTGIKMYEKSKGKKAIFAKDNSVEEAKMKFYNTYEPSPV